MKGQAILAMVSVLMVIVITVPLTFWVYGVVSQATPHDTAITNESMCTGVCAAHSNYTFDFPPIVDEASTFICYNETDLLVYDSTFTVTGNNDNLYLNGSSVSYENVECSYTYNWANTNEQSFWTTTTSNINSSFALGSIVPIIFAAVIIVVVIFLVGREG